MPIISTTKFFSQIKTKPQKINPPKPKIMLIEFFFFPPYITSTTPWAMLPTNMKKLGNKVKKNDAQAQWTWHFSWYDIPVIKSVIWSIHIKKLPNNSVSFCLVVSVILSYICYFSTLYNHNFVNKVYVYRTLFCLDIRFAL